MTPEAQGKSPANKSPRLQARFRYALLASTTAFLTLGSTAAIADISNTATATGTYNGTDYPSPPVTVNVVVQPAGAALTTSKSFDSIDTSIVGDSDIDPGDHIIYKISVDNTGNVTMTNVHPNDSGITFGGVAGTGTFSFSPANVASLAPSDTPVEFTATYTVSHLDILHAAAVATDDNVSNTATSTGTFGTTDTSSPPSTPAFATIKPDPELTVVKTASLQKQGSNTGTDAEVGDIIVYTYVINNTGNVAIDDVTVNDSHEDAPVALASFVEDQTSLADGPLANSADASTGVGNPKDGKWDTLAAGGSVTFTYTHTVTQTEYDNQ